MEPQLALQTKRQLAKQTSSASLEHMFNTVAGKFSNRFPQVVSKTISYGGKLLRKEFNLTIVIIVNEDDEESVHFKMRETNWFIVGSKPANNKFTYVYEHNKR